MTRKHFQELADYAAEYELTDHQVEGLVKFCKRQNNRFDQNRFWDAVEELRRQYK